MEAVEWWNDEYINTKYRDHFEAKMRKMYEDHFDAMKYDILTVRTRVGDEEVRFRMYGPKRTSQTDDIVTASIRRSHQWESKDNKYFQVRHHCQEDDSCGLFVDIGSNIGYWSLFMAHLGYDVLSFEAMTSNYLMLYATLQDLVSPSIRDRVRVFPVALSNVTRDSTKKCIICSHPVNTQDGSLVCGDNPSCDQLDAYNGVAYTERETVDVLNLKYFLEDMFPAMFSNVENRKVISNLKIDVEGHEPEVLYPILDLFEQGVIDKMFAECFGIELPQNADFFENEIGPRMKLLNPAGLEKCRSNIVNLKYERVSHPRSKIVDRTSNSDIKDESAPIKQSLFDHLMNEKDSANGSSRWDMGSFATVALVLSLLLLVLAKTRGMIPNFMRIIYQYCPWQRPHRE